MARTPGRHTWPWIGRSGRSCCCANIDIGTPRTEAMRRQACVGKLRRQASVRTWPNERSVNLECVHTIDVLSWHLLPSAVLYD